MKKEIKLKHIGEIMQQIYDSEIHIKFGWMWDGGVDFQEGAKTTDFWDELVVPRKTEEEDMCIAFEKICKHLLIVYPNSSFTEWFKKNFNLIY